MSRSTLNPRTSRRPAKPRPSTRASRDLPLSAVLLTCGDTTREYGLQAGDWVWCESCSDRVRVAQVLAA